MCTYSISVDENTISKIRPTVSREDFGVLLQHYVDELLVAMVHQSANMSPNAYTPAEMKSIVTRRILQMETGQATFVDGEDGFSIVSARYGL